jgi:T5SS/PEP-CTERM-associated repeat protein
VQDGGYAVVGDAVIGSGSDSVGTATVSGEYAIWEANTIVIGDDGGTGTLTVSDGGAVGASISVGAGEGSTGTLNILENGGVGSYDLDIGDEGGSGTVNVDGGRLSVYGSLYLSGEDGGSGSLTIANGGTVSVDAEAYVGIGSDQATIGTVTLTGEGSTLETELLYLGVDGATGMVSVSDGASLITNNDVYVGYMNNDTGSGTLTISGQSSTWEATGSLFVGYGSGVGTVSITDGSTVTILSGESEDGGDVCIGYENTDSSGSVTVDGSGSTLTISNDLLLGYSGGTGTLSITNGGSVLVSSDASLGTGSKSSASLLVSGKDSLFQVGDTLRIDSSGSSYSSILEIQDQALVQAGSLNLDGDEGTALIEINEGYLALEGNVVDDVLELIGDGLILYWNNTTGEWSSVSDTSLITDYFVVEYFETDEAAYAFSGYDDLGGYTILTSAPEPTTWALLAGCLVLGLTILRRRRAYSTGGHSH